MGNLRVAVCDDEPMDLVQTITLIQQYDTGKCFDIFSYTRAVDLLKIALEKPFDVVLLDIEMETPNGYDSGEQCLGATQPDFCLLGNPPNPRSAPSGRQRVL